MPSNKYVTRETAKKVREAQDDKYVIEGEYSPQTSVGYADESGALTPYGENSGAVDTSAFTMQTTGGSSDVGSKAYQKKLLGNTVCFNQLINKNDFPATQTINGITFTNNNNGSWTISGTASADAILRIQILNLPSNTKVYIPLPHTDMRIYDGWTTATINGINTLSGTVYYSLYVASGKVISSPITVYPQLFNLSIFGKEYTSAVDFNRDYPLPYYEYNTGTLLSCKTNGIKNVGYNAFDGQWTQNKAYSPTGAITDDNRSQISTNLIRVIAGQKYSFELDGDVSGWVAAAQRIVVEYDGDGNFIKYNYYSNGNLAFNLPLKITLRNNTQYVGLQLYNGNTARPQNNVAFHLTWDESRTGYEPKEYWEYPMPNVELKGGFDSNGVHWGDELTPDGTLTTGVGVVDLSQLSFTQVGSTWNASLPLAKSTANNASLPNAICDKYTKDTTNNILNSPTNKTFAFSTGSVTIRIYDTSITQASDITGTLYYELATSTTEQNDAYKFQEVQNTDDFGTQQALSEQTIQVPQAFDFFYPVDYKAFIDSLGGREDIEYDAGQVASKTDLEFKELSSSYIGSITSTTITTNFYKNEIAISGGLSNAKYVCALMSNGNLYPMMKTANSLVVFNGVSFQGSVTVSKIYYKE